MMWILEVTFTQPGVETFERFIGNALFLREICPIFDFSFDFHFLGRFVRIKDIDVKIVFFRVVDDLFQGQDPENIALGFFAQ